MEIRELLPIGMSLIVLGIALAYGMQVTADVGEDMACPTTRPVYYAALGRCCLSSTANCDVNATHGEAMTIEGNATIKDTIPALAKIPTKLALIVTVVIAVVIIGLIVRYLANVA